MADRCYYYVEDEKVKCGIVSIEWDCGFTREAKHLYIDRIISRVPDRYQICRDITTASPDYLARSLSPHILTMSDGRRFDTIYFENPSPAQHDWLYYQSLSEQQRAFIRECGSFTDVFHDPFKKGRNTQAHSAAVLQLFMMQGLAEEVSDFAEFEEWWVKCRQGECTV
jgi:hypothetical protein